MGSRATCRCLTNLSRVHSGWVARAPRGEVEFAVHLPRRWGRRDDDRGGVHSGRGPRPARSTLTPTPTITGSSASLIYAFVGAGDTGWMTAQTWALPLASAIGFALFVASQRKTQVPLMDVRLLARPAVTRGSTANAHCRG